jgi:hypothetical protein
MCGMKCACVLALGLWAILIGGCSHPLAGQADPVKVVVEGGGEFPIFLAGRWQAEQHGWEFQFESDGRISSAIISLGRVRVVPGKTTTIPTKSGDQAVFTPGVWLVHYAPSTTELTVKITMDHVRVEMAGNIVEGSSTDTFVGPITSTGQTWQAQWTTFTRYVAHAPENASFDLSTDPTDGETKPLTFQKVGRVSP